MCILKSMTIIAAIKDDKGVHYGSDSRITYSSGPKYDLSTKWRILKGKTSKSVIHIASAGSARLDNLIIANSKLIESAVSAFDIGDIIKKSVIADAWKEEKDDGGEPQNYDIDILIIFKNNIYRIGSDFSVIHIPDFTFVAIGSGEPYALGAVFAIKNKPAKELVRIALQAAIHYDPSCGGKINYGLLEKK